MMIRSRHGEPGKAAHPSRGAKNRGAGHHLPHHRSRRHAVEAPRAATRDLSRAHPRQHPPVVACPAPSSVITETRIQNSNALRPPPPSRLWNDSTAALQESRSDPGAVSSLPTNQARPVRKSTLPSLPASLELLGVSGLVGCAPNGSAGLVPLVVLRLPAYACAEWLLAGRCEGGLTHIGVDEALIPSSLVISFLATSARRRGRSIETTEETVLTMDAPFFHELRRQASSYLTGTIRSARLALTDVTPTQLLTEEATNGDASPPNVKTMGLIARQAFEIDEYLRIADILHRRFAGFDRRQWREGYKALLLLEHLLTHGPRSVALEFHKDRDGIRNMTTFQHIDEKGFNWGLTVKNKAERVLKLLERGPFLEEERERARKIAREIKGFGSFNLSSAPRGITLTPLPGDDGTKDSLYGRSNSKYEERWRRSDGDKENLLAKPRAMEAEEPHHHHPFHEFGHRPEAMLLLSQ